MYTESQLAKWSRMVRIRDGNLCRMCVEMPTERRLMHAHHIDMKSKHPDKALSLSNGVCLCGDCHLRVVHSTDTNHKQFKALFARWQRRKAVREFNAKWQHKLTE